MNWTKKEHQKVLWWLFANVNVPYFIGIMPALDYPTEYGDVEALVVEFHPDFAWVWK